jgi:hypothetical protein
VKAFQLLFVLIFCLPVFGQIEQSPQTVVDSIVVRHANNEHLARLREDPAFNYKEVPPAPSLLDIVFRYVNRFIAKIFRTLWGAPTWAQYLLIIFCCFIGYLIFRMQSKSGGLLVNKQKFPSAKIGGKDINIAELDLEALAQDALEHKDYKSAVHYLYLRVLQILTQNGFVTFHIEKTNHAYIRELEKQPFISSFRHITMLFEWIYYGEAENRADTWDDIIYEFREFISTVQGDRR